MQKILLRVAGKKDLSFPVIRISQDQRFDDLLIAGLAIIRMAATSTPCHITLIAGRRLSPLVNVGECHVIRRIFSLSCISSLVRLSGWF